MKNYKITIEDSSNNDLVAYLITANNLKDAKKILAVVEAKCMINDAMYFKVKNIN